MTLIPLDTTAVNTSPVSVDPTLATSTTNLMPARHLKRRTRTETHPRPALPVTSDGP